MVVSGVAFPFPGRDAFPTHAFACLLSQETRVVPANRRAIPPSVSYITTIAHGKQEKNTQLSKSDKPRPFGDSADKRKPQALDLQAVISIPPVRDDAGARQAAMPMRAHTKKQDATRGSATFLAAGTPPIREKRSK
jgi:hypothetical protein